MEILLIFGRNADFQAKNVYFCCFGVTKLRPNDANVVQTSAIFVHYETTDYADFTDLEKKEFTGMLLI